MKLICPVCSSKFELSDADRAQAYADLIDMASRFGGAWKLANEYIETFRSSQYGCVAMPKRLRLLQELARLWESCEFESGGKRYRTDHRAIREALTTVCNTDKFGFKNHNYLKKVLLDGAERVSAEGLTATEESQREAGKRLKAVGANHSPVQETDNALSMSEFKHRIGALADQIGRKCDGQKKEIRG